MTVKTETKCRYCGATKRNAPESGKDVNPDYCSGKCELLDKRPVAVTEAEFVAGSAKPEPVIILPEGVKLTKEGSLADYYDRPDQYHRRLNPEKLNWGVHLDMKQLKQAGLRANRKPIPGDWDFEAEEQHE